jgi:hypothetical protein
MANVTWTMRLYDINGNGISAANMNPIAPSTSNEIQHAFNRTLTIPLNGLDTLNFSLYLDDPMAANIVRLRTVVKLWRTIRNDGGSIIYSDNDPIFAGIVPHTAKNGDDNTMNITVQGALWRLQSRFHILNHYLKTNIDTDEPYTQSELMWKLIDLINNAFGLDDSNTGIVKGTFSAGNDPVMAPYFVPKGSNTWTNIFEEIMNRPGGVDIVPSYVHIDGDPTLMEFNTEDVRGNSNVTTFRYRTGSGDNLINLEEETQAVPGEFANYLWAVGDGGPNSGKIAMEENIDDDADGYHNIGIYMRRVDMPDIKKIGLRTPIPTHLRAIAIAELAQSRVPQVEYRCEISPAGNTYYGAHFNVGDTVAVVGSNGALNVNADDLRIYDATLAMTENNFEICSVSISEDFTGKVSGA